MPTSLRQPFARSVLACVLAASALSAQAQDFDGPEPRDDAGLEAANRYHQRLSAQLAAKGGARELALAAVLRGQFTQAAMQPDGAPDTDEPSQAIADDPDVSIWRRRAATASDRDLITNLLLLNADGDLRREAATRWAAAEPDNAAPLFFSGLSDDALFAAMRGKQRFDLHYLEEVRWLAKVYADTPPNDDEAATMFDDKAERATFPANAAMGLWGSSGALPRFDEPLRACCGAALTATPTRTADCRHAAEVLSGASDTAIGRAIGNVLLADTAPDDAARAAANEARRRMDWLLVQFGQAVRAQPDNGAAQLTRLLADTSIHTEIDLFSRVLSEAKIPLQPPADWQPPRRPPQR